MHFSFPYLGWHWITSLCDTDTKSLLFVTLSSKNVVTRSSLRSDKTSCARSPSPPLTAQLPGPQKTVDAGVSSGRLPTAQTWHTKQKCRQRKNRGDFLWIKNNMSSCYQIQDRILHSGSEIRWLVSVPNHSVFLKKNRYKDRSASTTAGWTEHSDVKRNVQMLYSRSNILLIRYRKQRTYNETSMIHDRGTSKCFLVHQFSNFSSFIKWF